MRDLSHYAMARGTFANIRLINKMVPKTGPTTIHVPTGEERFIFDVANEYLMNGQQSIVLAGKEYGSGSSRDWAAKGPYLLGIRAVIAESFERIHRSNLVGMGVLPLQFKKGESADTYGITGFETFDVVGVADGLEPKEEITVRVTNDSGETKEFKTICRLDSGVEVDYYQNGGILQTVIRQMISK